MTTDLSPEARRLLQEARSGFFPDETRVVALRSRIAARIAAPEIASSGAAPAARALGTWGASHIVVAALLVGALGAAGFTYFQSPTRAKALTAVVLPNSPLLELAPVVVPSALPPPPSLLVPNDPIAPSSIASPPPLARDHATESRVSGSRSTARSSSSVTAPPVAPAAPPTPVSAAPGAATDSLAEEIRLLRDARSALDRGDAARALASLRQHAEQFGRGTLYEERLATQVQALCLLGRIDAARSTASELARAAPQSPHLGRVQASCVGKPSVK